MLLIALIGDVNSTGPMVNPENIPYTYFAPPAGARGGFSLVVPCSTPGPQALTCNPWTFLECRPSARDEFGDVEILGFEVQYLVIIS